MILRKVLSGSSPLSWASIKQKVPLSYAVDAHDYTFVGWGAKRQGLVALNSTRQANLIAKRQKVNLRQHSVLDWSPTSILSGPCDACLRGSDETRNVHRGMAADENEGQ